MQIKLFPNLRYFVHFGTICVKYGEGPKCLYYEFMNFSSRLPTASEPKSERIKLHLNASAAKNSIRILNFAEIQSHVTEVYKTVDNIQPKLKENI